jgi:hypothetical protein
MDAPDHYLFSPASTSSRSSIGPKFLKLSGRVLYRLVNIEAYEEACLSTSTRSAVATNVAA